MKIFTSLLIILVSTLFAQAQFTLTPAANYNLQSVSVEVPQMFLDSFAAGKTLKVPAGYQARIFYTGGLNKPRALTFSPAGVLHVSDMNDSLKGRILAFPDANTNGVADTILVVASGFTNNHDVKFYKGSMYVSESFRIWKLNDLNTDGIYETRTLFIDSIGDTAAGNHVTRTMAFDSINQKLYVSIGSTCNVCRETEAAIIEQYNDDGSGRRVFATGVRNAVAMELHPLTNRLWAANNGSDNQGNETPPEWVDIVRDGGFYGHPFAYADKVWFNFDTVEYVDLKPITATDSAMVADMVAPAGLLRAHSAPLEIEFMNNSFPNQFRNGFLISEHGSWNTTKPRDFRGYKVVYADLTNAQDTTINTVGDFALGFLTDSINRVYWGRPVGLAADNNGNVFISSDQGNNFIMQVYQVQGLRANDLYKPVTAGIAYPNPFRESFTVPLNVRENSLVQVTVCDLLGREIKNVLNENLESGDHNIRVDWSNMPDGLYLLKVTSGDTGSIQKIHCIR